MEASAYLFDLHKAHVAWKKDLAFYEDELQVLKKRLSEVSIQNTSQDIKMKVEPFRNKFIIQKE